MWQPNGADADDENDVYKQLEQKDQDLVLAAELGKALLEENNELTRKLEELEEERHALRRQLQYAEDEYEQRVTELHQDVQHLRHELNQSHVVLQEAHKERQDAVTELTEHNSRLQNELTRVNESEQSLHNELKAARESVDARRISLHEHVAQLAGLKEEILSLTEKRDDLEHKIQELGQEREDMLGRLEETQDRVSMLEKEKREHERLLHDQEVELSELHYVNAHLQEQIEQLRNQSLLESSGRSLFDELRRNEDDDKVSMHEQDAESDDELMMQVGFQTAGNEPCLLQELVETEEFRQEILAIYRQLRSLCSEQIASVLEIRSGAPQLLSPEAEDTVFGEMEQSTLMSVLHELRALLHDMLCRQLQCLPRAEVDTLRRNLETSLVHNETVQSRLARHEEHVRHQEDELTHLTQQLQISSEHVAMLQGNQQQLEERIRQMTEEKELLLDRARKDQEEASVRHRELEARLASVGDDFINVSGQLMDAVRQKVELSRRIDEWEFQGDMECVVSERVHESGRSLHRSNSLTAPPSPEPELSRPRSILRRVKNLLASAPKNSHVS